MRTLIRIFLVLAIFVTVSLIGLHIYFSPERLHPLIQNHLQETLHRPVTFTKIERGYGLEPRIELHNLTIQDNPAFSKTPFIQTQRAHLSLSPLSFLMGQGKIGSLNLNGGTLRLITNRKGESNTQDLFQKQTGTLPINHIELTNITVIYHNQQTTRQTTSLFNTATLLVTQSENGFQFSGQADIQNLTTQLKTNTTHLPASTLSFQGQYTPQTKNIQIEKLTVALGPITTNLTGNVHWQTLKTNLHTQNEALNFEHIKSYLINHNLLSDQASLSGEGQLNLKITGDWPPQIDGKLTAKNIGLADPQHLKNPIIKGQITLNTNGTEVRLHTLSFQSGLSDITLSGVMSNLYQRPHLSFALVSHIADIDGFRKPPLTQAQWALTTPAYAAPNKKKSALLSLLNRLDMDGSMHADSLRMHNTWIQNFRVKTNAQGGRLTLTPITGQAHQGALNGRATLTTHEQGAHIESNLSLINTHVHPLLNETLNWQIPLYGNITLSAQFAGALDTTFTYLPTTTQANGRIQMQTGKIVDWDLLQNSLKSVEQLGLLTADNVPIKDATIVFNLQGNTLTLNGSQFSAANMPCRVSGTGEINGALQYALDIDVPPTHIQFGGFNLGALLGQRAIPVRVNIGGTTRAPKITAGLR